MADPYEQAARARRNPAIQKLIDTFAEEFDIEQDFMDSSEHPFSCRCEKCLSWWASMGPEDPDELTFGPFNQEEVEAHCKKQEKEIWW